VAVRTVTKAFVPFRFSFTGKPPAGAVLLRSMIHRSGYIGPNQAGSDDESGSLVKAGTAPTAAVTLNLALNGTVIGTVKFAIGSKVATYTTTGGTPTGVEVGDAGHVLRRRHRLHRGAVSARSCSADYALP
jgi:hypothetical protein